MRRQIDYHLAHARAAASGATPGASAQCRRVGVRAWRARCDALHADRGLDHRRRRRRRRTSVRVQREDLDEMLGNLLDNACTWARTTVACRRSQTRDGDVHVLVDDDGPGVPPALRDEVLQRGVRADEAAPGSGLGPGDRRRSRRAVRRRDRRRDLPSRRCARPPRPSRSGSCGVILRHGWRMLATAPVLSAVVIASLAIGIGVNTAVFSWIRSSRLAPLPGVPRAAEFHLVEPRTGAGAYPGASWLEFQDLRTRLAATADLMAFRMAPLNVGEAERTERVFALLVSEGYFRGPRRAARARARAGR